MVWIDILFDFNSFKFIKVFCAVRSMVCLGECYRAFKTHMYFAIVGGVFYLCLLYVVDLQYCSSLQVSWISFMQLFCPLMRWYFEVSNYCCSTIPPFSFVSVCFMYFRVLLLRACIFRNRCIFLVEWPFYYYIFFFVSSKNFCLFCVILL